jgi:hypothetical protein
MVFLGDEAQMELILLHLEIVLILWHDWCMVCAKYTIGSKSLWTHPMVRLGDEARVKARFGPFGGSANLCAECTIRLGKDFGHTRWNF